MLVTGRTTARQQGYLDRALLMLRDAGADVVVFDEVSPNPTDELVDAGGKLAREEHCHLVVGLGGGSAMDAAKGIAVAATHEFAIREFILPNGQGEKRVPTDVTLPVVCVTTTAGTSSELTPFAVLTMEQTREKAALAHPLIYPRVGICDPELTYPMPAEVTAATGIDVLCHATEGYLNTTAGPLTDHAAEETIRLVGEYLPRAVADGGDKEARYFMSLANVFAGYPLSNCGATILHALEHPISGHNRQVAHGAGLAALLAAYARTCWGAAPEKWARVAALLNGPEEPQEAAEALERLLEKVGLNVGLSALGVKEGMLETIADDARRYMGGALGKTPGCPERECLMGILRGSL
jgi:alcohol dehydrogenase class IV